MTTLEDPLPRLAVHAGGPDSQQPTTISSTLVPVVVGLLIGLTFVAVFLAAFHDPVPRHLPIAVVAPAPAVAAVQASAASHEDALTVVTTGSGDAARAAVRTRKVLGAFIVGPTGSELVLAGANGPSVTENLQATFAPVARAAGGSLVVTDVSPLSAGDSRGLSIFYAAFGVVLAGFLFGLTSLQLGARLPVRCRAVSAVIFATAAGLLVATLVQPLFGALPAPFGLTALVVGLLALAVATTTEALLKTFGPAGPFIAAVVLLVFGNATSTGILPAPYLPDWLEPLTAVLPVGVAVRALRGAAYFANDGLTSGIVVLTLWAVAAVLLYGVGQHREDHRAGREQPTRTVEALR